jgi:hypothetical protein
MDLAFSMETSQQTYSGFNMEPMNASMAGEYIGLSDLMLSTKSTSFLGDPASTVDLSPPGDIAQGCGLNGGEQGTSSCRRRYFIPGISLVVTPELVGTADFPQADTILASHHRGYLLEFDAGDSSMKFDADQDCRTYSGRYLGFKAGAIRLCVGSSGPNELQARK